MNQELKRIKSKDFTQLDQKLYDDLSRADNLTSALSQLSDFQRFLMEQITNLNHNQPNANSNLIARSIARNFDHLKESLVKCSRIQEKSQKSKVLCLKDQIKQLKEDIKKAKSDVKQQVCQVGAKNEEAIKKFMDDVLLRFEKEKQKNQEIVKKYQELQSQNEKLKQENLKLIKISNPQKVQEKSNGQMVQHLAVGRVYTASNCYTPLKQSNYLQKVNSSIVNKDECWKVTRNQVPEGLQTEMHQKRSNSLKRQTSNHEISRKTHINCLMDKENENFVLKSKGVTMQELKRGKSKQKIKLVSMI